MTHKFIERVQEFDAKCFEGSNYAADDLIRWIKSIDPTIEATFLESNRDKHAEKFVPNRVEIRTNGYVSNLRTVFPGWWVVNRNGHLEVLSQQDFWHRYERKS